MIFTFTFPFPVGRITNSQDVHAEHRMPALDCADGVLGRRFRGAVNVGDDLRPRDALARDADVLLDAHREQGAVHRYDETVGRHGYVSLRTNGSAGTVASPLGLNVRQESYNFKLTGGSSRRYDKAGSQQVNKHACGPGLFSSVLSCPSFLRYGTPTQMAIGRGDVVQFGGSQRAAAPL